MYNSIIISSCLFGSIYLFSQSLYLLNISFIENKKPPTELIIINGLTFVATGTIFISSYLLLKPSHFTPFN